MLLSRSSDVDVVHAINVACWEMLRGEIPRQLESVETMTMCVCVYYYRTYYKAVRVGEEESGGHVL